MRIRDWSSDVCSSDLRLITGFAEVEPWLVLDLVPAGEPGMFKLFFKDEPKAKTKVTLVTQSGWSKEEWTDEQGLVAFDMPWSGTYVAEASVNDGTPGEREGANGEIGRASCRERVWQYV